MTGHHTPHQTIEHLLDWYPTVREGVNTGSSGDGPGWLTTHHWWHQGSFPQLERYLLQMRQYRLDTQHHGIPLLELRQHIDWWHLEPQRRTIPLLKPVKRHGKTIGYAPTGSYTVHIQRDPRANAQKAQAGVDWLATQFHADRITPRLPVELWRIITGQPDKLTA